MTKIKPNPATDRRKSAETVGCERRGRLQANLTAARPCHAPAVLSPSQQRHENHLEMLMIRRMRSLLLAAALAGFAGAGVQAAEPAAGVCTAATFAEAVDKFGASLRGYNAEAQPRMRARLTALAEKKGWTGEDREERAMFYLEDGRLGELDTQANELLSKVDQYGKPNSDGSYDCGKLAEIEAASIELLAVMKTKAAYLDDKVAREIGPAKAEPAALPLPASKPLAGKAASTPGAVPPEAAAKVATVPPAVRKSEAAKGTPAPQLPADTIADGVWDTKSKSVVPLPADGVTAAGVAAVPGQTPSTLPPITFDTSTEGYTIDEIRDVTRGFFGTISTNLASVIEHAFSNSGRPTGYILGTEGGGAFLAGLRYGKGTLYLRQGGTQPIHWHGPSIGYDLGADGGRTLILVYRMREPAQLYRSFSGVDGSAYLVGGVGMTLLKGGDVIMAPIRSGLGLRLGASIGYLRFTSQPTWNPF
jgi:hypothetical protein